MNRKMGRIATLLFVATSIICVSLSSYAHSGRTDSNGGHKDDKNKSGLGSYHYHCGGHPAHLHPNGVCPYSSTSSKKSSTTSSSSKSSSKTSSSASTTSTKTTTVKATKIEINEGIDSIYIGESETLTFTISPSNVTNKKVTWKSSNEDIATVSSTGKVIAKGEGKVKITVSTSNGKTDTIEINIIEEKKEVEVVEVIEENDVIETSATVNISNINNNTYNSVSTVNDSEEDSAAGGIVLLGLAGGGYWLYRKNKKKKE